MTTIVEVRGEPGLFKTTDLPSEEISLPMALGTSRWLPWAGLSIGVIGLLLAPTMLALLYPMPADFGFGTKIYVTVMCVVGTAGGWWFLAVAFTAFADAFRRGPLLYLDDLSLWDKRATRMPLAWTDIKHAAVRFDRSGAGGVHFKLRRAVQARHNLFRIGTLFPMWRQEPDELYVSVRFLSLKPRTIALVITEMVNRNGGSADTKYPMGGEL